MLDLQVRAPRFAFQEWAGVIRGLQNIAVDAAFETSLKGPVNQLATDLQLTGTGGGVKGQLTLDTSVPGLARRRRGRRHPPEPRALAESRRSAVGHHRPRHVRSRPRARPPFPARRVHVRRPARDVHGLRRGRPARARSAHGDRSPDRRRHARPPTAPRSALTSRPIGLDAPFPFRFQGRTDRHRSAARAARRCRCRTSRAC